MSRLQLVRFGVVGSVGRFTSSGSVVFPRGARVVARSRRGLETGEVLAALDDTSSVDAAATPTPDGVILRAMTVEDDLLKERLERNRGEAFDACVRMLAERNLDAVLLDVEPLFDGRRLIFYFLGEVSADVAAVTDDLADIYDTSSELGRFAETLTSGCGPGCGTEEAAGMGCGACTSCAVACAR